MKKIVILLVLICSNSLNAQWTALNSGTTEDLNEVFFPVTDTGYVVGYYGTVLKTINGGTNWTSLNTGLNKTFNELYFLSANEGWIVGDSGSVCHTVNGGTNWNCSFIDSAEYINLHSVYARNSNEVFIGGNNFSSNGYLAKTINGGSTWQRAFVESYMWDIDIKKIGMVSATTGYAVTRGDVLKTTDSGMNWMITDTASVHAGAQFVLLEDLAFFPNNDTIYTCGWYGGYFGKTINGGTLWQHNFTYQNYNLDFLNPQVGYIGGWGQLHKTTDGGATFTDASGGNTNLFDDIYSIDFTDELTVYACGYGGKIIKTTNGGLGLSDLSSTSIQVYPNPTKDLVNFSVNADVQLVSSLGRVITEKKHTGMIDLSTIPVGTYFLIFTDDKNEIIHREKLVKE